jgi:hypothetical protein
MSVVAVLTYKATGTHVLARHIVVHEAPQALSLPYGCFQLGAAQKRCAYHVDILCGILAQQKHRMSGV